MICSNFNQSEAMHHFDSIPTNPFEPAITTLLLVVEAPSFSIPKLSKLRNTIYTNLIDKYDKYDKIVTPNTLDELSIAVCQAINYPFTKMKTVRNILAPLFQAKEVTDRLLYIIATKISGNISRIKQNQVVPRWEDTDVPIWVPVEIMGQQEVYGAYPGKEIKAFISGGLPAGMTLKQKVSNKFIQYMLREIGYPKYKKFNAQEIYNTRFTCNILKNKGATKMVAFSVSGSQSKHNKTLYKIRHGECPNNFNIECTNCLMGLNECSGALHRARYFVGDCDNGHRGIINPDHKKCNKCIEFAKYEQAKAMFEKRRKQ